MIGVCIKYFFENYGGMLQAYATTKWLESMGIDYELIRYEKSYNLIGKIKQIPRLFNRILLNDKKEALIKKIGKKKHPEFASKDAIRINAFKQFNESHFTKLSPVFVGYKALCAGANRYNAVMVGSDQLWSPAGLPTNFFNLNFVPDNIRKISVASSFGVGYIPKYQIKRTRNYLNRIEFVSMRENRGSEIVKELTGRDVPTILDPVFFFDENGWEKLIPYNKELEEPYIFAYFLGKNPEYRESVKEAAKGLGCKIVALRHMDQYVDSDEAFGDYAPYDVDPSKFLNLLRGASYVCTDSFHGTVFSIIHHKSFVTFDRYSNNSKHSKNSRIDSLCQNLGIEDRRYKPGLSLISKLTIPINYQIVENKLNKIKEATNIYLANAFKGL